MHTFSPGFPGLTKVLAQLLNQDSIPSFPAEQSLAGLHI